MKKMLAVCSLLVSLFASGSLLASPFEQGQVHLSLTGGTVNNGAGDWGIVVGAGVGYMIIDYLELGVDGEYWAAIDPAVFTLSPNARFWIPLGGGFFPYVGSFFSHSFVEKFDDMESFGFRTGVAFMQSRGAYLSLGWAFERYLMGAATVGLNDNDWINYPEISFGLSF